MGDSMIKKLEVKELFNAYDDNFFEFETTEELIPLQSIIGQQRAVNAIDFGLKMKQKGYNIFVAGDWGTGRNSYVKLITEDYASKKSAPSDWVYVNNFKNYYNPIALSFEKGNAKIFAKAVDRAISLIERQIKEVFLSKEYENSRMILIKEFNRNNKHILEELNLLGEKYGFHFSQSDQGLVSIPIKNDGQEITEEEYKNLSSEEFEELKNSSHNMNIEAIEYLNKLKAEEDRLSNKIRNLDEQTGKKIIEFHIMGIKKKIKVDENIQVYLNDLIEDLLENLDYFKGESETEVQNPMTILSQSTEEDFLDRYKVNVLIDNSKLDCAPVVFENNPTYMNLMGVVEYKNEMGVLRTDFMQIKPGSLHSANGGYLVVQAKDILSSFTSWKSLKRALITGEIQIDPLSSQSNYIVTTTLKPSAIPLDLKVIIIGDQETYDALYDYDEDFRKLFKVMADFDSEMTRNEENIHKIARFIANHTIRDGLRHFDKNAVKRVIEYSSRLSEDKNKLSSSLNKLVELLYEADTWAQFQDDELVEEKHIVKAIDQIMERNNKVEEKILEMFQSGDYLIDVVGEKIGEINGLAVMGTGQYSFGKPSKITVSTYRGKSGIINIEREAKTSGRIHDKGVMILTGYMGYKYAQDKPLALNASIVFEQLYSGVDGDSASSTELYALLSSLSGLPINQGLAVTGSVNQRGMIQPIGGVNEKIEGFYKVCKIKGINSQQGVIIPFQNERNLMLSQEVRDAVNNGTFHIYSVSTIDEGIEVLTGVKAGDINVIDTVHYLVNEKLKELGNDKKGE
jgi:lon-related putative ATP-dependent protease